MVFRFIVSCYFWISTYLCPSYISGIKHKNSNMSYKDDEELMREIEATLFDSNLLDCIISGTTHEPRQGFNAEGGPDELRVGNFQQIWGSIYTPFINMDKKDLALIYKEHNLLSTLFPITRSCITETMNFDAHCGECWWCKERIWAFGKL